MFDFTEIREEQQRKFEEFKRQIESMPLQVEEPLFFCSKEDKERAFAWYVEALKGPWDLEEDEHEGMVYNEVTDTWSWL